MNNIELITKYATEAWDKVYKKQSISSIFDGEKDLMKFVGVKTVRIAKHSSDGMGFYQRANKPAAGPFAAFDAATPSGTGYGYPTGDVNLTWETFEIRIDRARQLRIELFDNEESGELAVTSALSDFSRTKVVPEVDAYVFSTIAGLAAWTSESQITLVPGQVGYNPDGAFQALNDGYTVIEDKGEVPEEDQVVLASYEFINKLRSSGEVVKVLKQNEYKENVDFSVYEYMGREIIGVPGRRFRTDIVLNDNGFGWGENSKQIDFIICAKSAVYHVVKYDKIRVFEPKMVQDFDGYKVNVRVYHDCFVPDNKRVAIYAHLSDAAAPTNTISYKFNAANAALGTANTLSNVAVIPGDILIDGFYAADAAPAIGTEVVEGSEAVTGKLVIGIDCFPVGIYTPLSLTADTYYLFGVRNGVVVAVNSTDSFTIAA